MEAMGPWTLHGQCIKSNAIDPVIPNILVSAPETLIDAYFTTQIKWKAYINNHINTMK